MRRRKRQYRGFGRTLRLLCHLFRPAIVCLDLFLALLTIAYNVLRPDTRTGAKETAQKRSNDEETREELIHGVYRWDTSYLWHKGTTFSPDVKMSGSYFVLN